MKRQLVFMHIPKTAGATLTGAISNRFADRDCRLLYYQRRAGFSDLDSARYVSAHMPIGFLDRLRDPPFVFTFLRDPVERALSAYSFLRTLRPDDTRQVLVVGQGPEAYDRLATAMRLARELSLDDMVEGAPELAIEFFGNRQARALGDFQDKRGEEHLARALDGLERCDFIGLSERLDEGVLWLTRRLGWRELGALPKVNVSRNRVRRGQLAPSTIARLEGITAVDRELYRHAVDRYERDLAEWRSLRDPRDRSADIPDAEPLEDLAFDEAIPGTGWVGRDRIGQDPPFCWIGDTKSASVELGPRNGASKVRIEIPHALDQSIVRGLLISVDGRVVSHHLAEEHGTVVASASIRRRLLRRRAPVEVRLDVDRTTRPCDVDPSSRDDREFSLAVRRIALDQS